MFLGGHGLTWDVHGSYGSHEPVSALRDRLNVLLIRPPFAEELTQQGDVTREAALFYERVGPDPLKEFVFFDEWGIEAPFAVDPPGTRHTAAGPPGA